MDALIAKPRALPTRAEMPRTMVYDTVRAYAKGMPLNRVRTSATTK